MRPSSITVLCVVLFVIGGSQLIGSVIIVWTALGLLSVAAVIINVVALYAYYGLWQMRMWNVVAFMLIWIFNLLLLSLTSIHITAVEQIRGWVIMLVIAVYLAAVLPHWKKLSNS